MQYLLQEVWVCGRTNTVLQAAFFKLINILPIEDAVQHMKAAIKKTYGRKGERIVNMNCDAVDAGVKVYIKWMYRLHGLMQRVNLQFLLQKDAMKYRRITSIRF